MIDILDVRDLGVYGGFDLIAALVPDDQGSVPEAYGVIVRAFKNGVQLGEASLWDTDEFALAGHGEAFAHGYGPGLIIEAVADAHDTLETLIR